MSYLIGVDIGTGSTKGVLTGPDGTLVATARRDHAPTFPQPGWAEMDAEQDWWGDVVAVLRELTTAHPEARVAAVCVSGLGPCVVQTDAELQPRRPAILYGVDTRATAEIDEITTRLGADAILVRCGKDLSSQAIGPKLAWLRREAGDAWQPQDRWFSAHTYVVARLTGEWVLDHHTASQCDPFYDIQLQDWATDWVEAVLPGLALPRLVWPAEVVGNLHAEAAAATGLAVGTPVLAGTVDAWAEAFSVGVRRPGDLMLMYGSTMFFVQVLTAPTSVRGLWTTSGVERGSHTLAAGMATSGIITNWLQELTGGVPFDTLVCEAAAVPAGSEGLVMLPYFSGERTPIYDPLARGVIAGLTLRHQRGHLLRATYEGIACGVRQIVAEFEAAAGQPARVVAVGGGTQGGLWTQIVSDVTGLSQQVPAQTIGAAYGDALMAAIGVGLVPAETDWAQLDHTVQPNPATTSTYATLFRTYAELYPATRRQVHRLARSVQTTDGGE
ncbi:FGGY-family carbohydrate kinase [Kribbella sandramycini]|uniref:FGGY-family carbohydrate kinase n=1 Tax=Kribbella sandramycini TaxID=60450 RepID=A0A7Y4NXE7_9ACTN|nr:FGGY-family carbohydrate kinase [Kribbella sandramycini]MBB6567584.1 xylulokinase [Kribbella sandramycini]NOL39812.1 FGGY-family carbohydrate kinase [Kribbella sandramycini]